MIMLKISTIKNHNSTNSNEQQHKEEYNATEIERKFKRFYAD